MKIRTYGRKNRAISFVIVSGKLSNITVQGRQYIIKGYKKYKAIKVNFFFTYSFQIPSLTTPSLLRTPAYKKNGCVSRAGMTGK